VAEATLASETRPSPRAPAPPSTAGRGFAPSSLLQLVLRQPETTVVLVTVVAVVYFSIKVPAFASVANIITIVQYMASIAVIGFGEVLILVLGEIDLSAGAVYLSSPWFVYFIWSSGIPLGWSIAIAMAVCIAIGLLNGLVTVWLRVPSLIVTLAVNYILFGIVLVVSSATQEDMPGTTGLFGRLFGIGDWSTILWTAGIMIVIWSLLKRTKFGVHVVATGGNLLGAAESGIRVRRVKVWCFIIIAAASGLIGILDGIRIESINPGNSGLDYVLPGIVAAVLGGTALTGGRGTIIGTAIGAIFLGVLEDGLNVLGVSANWFFFAEGVMILVAMAANLQLGTVATRLRR
jgi:simple sugar transport system permease protein